RKHAARSLGKLGPEARRESKEVLVGCLKDNDRGVRAAAAEALASAPGSEDVPLFADMLKHQDADVRVQGAKALGKLGAQARAAAPQLLAAGKAGDTATRCAALDAAVMCDPQAPELVPALSEALKSPDTAVRRTAAVGLGRLQGNAKAAVPALK